MEQIKYVLNWIVGMSINIICDFLIMLVGIFSEETRKMYVEKFYPQLLIHKIKEKKTNENRRKN